MTIDGEFRNPMDALVVGSVRDLIGKPGVSLGDDFFDVGGNSIIAIRLGRVLSEELGIPRTVRLILKNPVLSELSDALSELAADPA
jgi:hypothetical protein